MGGEGKKHPRVVEGKEIKGKIEKEKIQKIEKEKNPKNRKNPKK